MDDAAAGNPQDVVVPPVEGVAGGGTAYGWNEGGVDSSSLLNGSIDPSVVPTADLAHVWCMPNSANVGPQDMPRNLEPLEMREKVSKLPYVPKYHGVVLALQGLSRLVVGQSITMRRVVAVLGVPDALVPLDLPSSQINLVPGETSAVWISIDVPPEQPPGQYEGEVIVTALKNEAVFPTQSMGRAEKHQLYMELQNCLDIVEPIDGKPLDEVVERVKSATTSLRRVLLSPSFSEFSSDNGSVDSMDEDAISNLSVRMKLNLTVWDFVIPTTPSLPAVFGISDTVIEDRFGVEHGTNEWYEALDRHFKWLLQYRISPYFCRWGESMRVLAYTSPWPAGHPKSDEYLSDPRLAAYAVPYSRAVSWYIVSSSSLVASVRKK
ncbi:hypothetical protein LINGRAHAP2_LOCUS23879 [Linum grandiflorum]